MTKKAQENKTVQAQPKAQELITLWIKSKANEKEKFALSNFIKEELIITAGTTQLVKKEWKYDNITSLIIIDTLSYLLSSQLKIKIDLDIKNKKVIFSDLNKIESTLTVKQKNWYNMNKDCNFVFTNEELNAEKEEQNKLINEEYAEISEMYGINIEQLI